MALTKTEIERLLGLIGRTEEVEIDCDQCLSLVAEYAEKALAGEPISAVLTAVEQHLAVCSECREEYEALQRALEALDPPT